MRVSKPRGGGRSPPAGGGSSASEPPAKGDEDRPRRGSDSRAGARRQRERERDRRLEHKAGSAGGPILAGLAEVAAIAREMLAIPASMALGLAERLGLAILAVLRFLRPIALAALALARRGIDFAARELTPARAIGAVALAACVLLAVSQFLDYREVRAGVPAYAEVEQVAPPPQVSGTTRTAGSAHLYLLLAVAIGAGALVILSMLGRWRLARLLFPLGLLALAIAVFIDAPAGLDEGATAIQFEGAEARLLGAFWVEVTAAAVIAICGPLLALALRPQRAARRRAARADRPRRRPSLRRSRVQGAGAR
jgi:hypothetical protein